MTSGISSFLPNHNQSFRHFQGVQLWIHDHPTTVKIIEISAAIIGLGLLAAAPFAAPIIGANVLTGLVVSGIFLTLVSTVAWLALDYLAPSHHNMANHIFKCAEHEGGKLYYEGDIPILSLNSDDPYKAGQAQGFLCGEAIHRIHRQSQLVFQTLMCKPRSHQIPHTLDRIRHTIPPEYLREMQGLVDGYHQWKKEHWWEFSNNLTLDDLILFHLFPDLIHFNPIAFEKQNAESPREPLPIACTAIIDRTQGSAGFKFARNLDCASLGIVGSHSLIIHRKYTSGCRSTIEAGIPGFIGTLTGMNDQNLCLSQNLCIGNTQQIRGMPSSLYLRHCLEHCQNMEDLERFVNQSDPLGPFHLVAADRARAQTFHFYQSPENTHLIRRWEPEHPLITLNCRYSPTASLGRLFHQERQEAIDQFFQHRRNRPLEEVLTLPYVSNWQTVHRVLMDSDTGAFKVAFDNAFAGREVLHSVPTDKLFGRQ
jgi:hypothetical protein